MPIPTQEAAIGCRTRARRSGATADVSASRLTDGFSIPRRAIANGVARFAAIFGAIIAHDGRLMPYLKRPIGANLASAADFPSVSPTRRQPISIFITLDDTSGAVCVAIPYPTSYRIASFRPLRGSSSSYSRVDPRNMAGVFSRMRPLRNFKNCQSANKM